MRRKNSPKFHVENGVENRKFHANFTLPLHSADNGKGRAPRAQLINFVFDRDSSPTYQGKSLIFYSLVFYLSKDIALLENAPRVGSM